RPADQVEERLVLAAHPRRSLPLLDALEEAGDDLAVVLWILGELHVRAVLEGDELGTGDSGVERLRLSGGELVVLARGDQRRLGDLAQAVADIPVLQRSGDHELVWPLHRQVDVRM